ncbi:MAG: ABC transporter permease [Nocardioides sp.]
MSTSRGRFWGRSSGLLVGRLIRIAIVAVPLAVLAVFFVLPVTGMVGRGLWADDRFNPVAVLDVLARPRTRRVLWFTFWSASAGTMLSMALGLPAAYVVSRLRVPGRRLIRAALLLPFVLPTVVVGVAFRQVLAGPLGFLDADGSSAAIVAALAFFNVAVVVRTVGLSWETLDPRPAEAAAALGAGPATVLRTVTLPALRPAILAAGTVVFLYCATAFGVVLMLGGLRYATVETEIYLLTTNLLDLQAAAALSILQLLMVVTLLVAVGRLDRTPTATVARRARWARRPAVTDVPALVLTGVALALVAVPLLTLTAGALRSGDRWTLAHFRRLSAVDPGLGVSLWQALVNSCQVAVDATWMALVLGVAVAYAVEGRGRARRVLEGVVMLPLGVSAVTLGFGFLITLDRPPLDLRGSALLVPLAQALVALPVVVRILVPILRSIDPRQRQAAASLGAAPWRAAWVVDWPVMRAPVLTAAGFAFAVSLGEFGATSFLVTDREPTLPVLIYRLSGQPGAGSFGAALAASVVLAVLIGLVMYVVDRIGSDERVGRRSGAVGAGRA